MNKQESLRWKIWVDICNYVRHLCEDKNVLTICGLLPMVNNSRTEMIRLLIQKEIQPLEVDYE